ncbi:MAG TPA: RecX family transcriptional regulator [Stellaceae bacterium]|nr:RecX family transcriptional regulator [Stellaceae bacterium]
MAESRMKRAGKAPRKITAQRLENIALHYLGRYASSSTNLRRVLMRRVERAAAAHGADPGEGAKLVEDLVARYLRSGLIDDRAYAAQKAASLQRRGASRFGIKGKLRQQGVAGALIDDALQGLEQQGGGASELASACALVRRRRLGPYREKGRRAAMRDKDLAALSRAGFGFAVARRVLAAPDVAALERLARGSAAEE